MGSGNNNIQTGSVPFNIRVSVAMEFGYSLDQIINISGQRVEILNTETELWQGTATIAEESENHIIDYEVVIY